MPLFQVLSDSRSIQPIVQPVPENKETYKSVGMIQHLSLDLLMNDKAKLHHSLLEQVITCLPHLQYLKTGIQGRQGTYCSFTATTAASSDDTTSLTNHIKKSQLHQNSNGATTLENLTHVSINAGGQKLSREIMGILSAFLPNIKSLFCEDGYAHVADPETDFPGKYHVPLSFFFFHRLTLFIHDYSRKNLRFYKFWIFGGI